MDALCSLHLMMSCFKFSPLILIPTEEVNCFHSFWVMGVVSNKCCIFSKGNPFNYMYVLYSGSTLPLLIILKFDFIVKFLLLFPVHQAFSMSDSDRMGFMFSIVWWIISSDITSTNLSSSQRRLFIKSITSSSSSKAFSPYVKKRAPGPVQLSN